MKSLESLQLEFDDMMRNMSYRYKAPKRSNINKTMKRVKQYLDAGVNVNVTLDSWGTTPIDVAVRRKHEKLLELLLDYGATLDDDVVMDMIRLCGNGVFSSECGKLLRSLFFENKYQASSTLLAKMIHLLSIDEGDRIETHKLLLDLGVPPTAMTEGILKNSSSHDFRYVHRLFTDLANETSSLKKSHKRLLLQVDEDILFSLYCYGVDSTGICAMTICAKSLQRSST